MEVAGRYDHVLVREDVGIVGGGIDLVLDDGFHVKDIILHGPVDLRNAAETVRVLHMLLVPGDEFAPFEDFHEFFSRQNLAFVGTQMMG